MPCRSIQAINGHSSNNFIDWLCFARETEGKIIDTQPKYIGTSQNQVKIDDKYMAERNNFGKGRILTRDIRVLTDDDGLLDWN